MKKEALLVGALTLFFLGILIFRLGTLDFPSSDWKPPSPKESFYVDLGREKWVERAFLLVQDGGKVEMEVFCGVPGSWRSIGRIKISDTWRSWEGIGIDCHTRYVRFSFLNTTARLGELVLFSGGRRLMVGKIFEAPAGALALFDEQDYLTSPPTNENSTYFDEIYFVRAAEEYLRSEKPFEWVHPPLGKILIALGVAIFGSVPFGWRIVGVLASAAAIPLIFLLGREIFGRRCGIFASFLLSFDAMHFVEGRLATVDSFVFLFLLLMFYFFYRAIEIEKIRKSHLFLSLLFFGFALATKWVSLFGFAGLLILLGYLKLRQRGIGLGEAVVFVLGCLSALAIYFLSFIPLIKAGYGVLDVLMLQVHMYRYHWGLRASHPFSSPWWSWPLMLKPLWMYFGETDGGYSVIFSIGNPALWWAGLPMIGLTFAEFCRGRDFRLLFLIIPFFSQWVMFSALSRPTFIYYFFPNVIFMALASSYWLDRWCGKRRGLVLAYLSLNVAFFFLLYPLISGFPLPKSIWDLIVQPFL